MSDANRSLWGDEPTPVIPPKRPSSLRIILVLLSGVIAALIARVILNMMGLTLVTGADATPAEIEASVWALAIMMGALVEIAVLFSPMLPLSNTAKVGRTFRIVVTFFALGLALAAAAYLLMGFLVPDSAINERLVLPGLMAVFFTILAGFSPVMPIWPVNVPDNRVFMILDNNDHLVKYVPAGIHMIRPLQGYAPYTEAGVMVINIDDESVVSSDAFPYRVRANIVCLFNPLKADTNMWVMLRQMTKDMLSGILKSDIEFIIRHAVARYVREGIMLSETLNMIAMDVKETVNARANYGISLVPLNPIKIILDPPKLIVEARQRRMSVEALALPSTSKRDQPLKNLLQLLSPDSDLNMGVNADGQINFALTPGNDIEIGESLEQAIMSAASMIQALQPQQPSLPAEPAAPKAIPPDLSLTQPATGSSTRAVDQTQEQPAEQADQSMPANPVGPKDDAVIDTDVDSEGVYIPRNPLGPRPG